MIIRSHIRSLVRGVSLSPIAGEGAGGGAAPIYPIDDVGGTAPLFAYSTRKLTASYTGSALRVVRPSDSATLDVGFVGQELDTTALDAFLGSELGEVDIWYDQSGNGNNATQTTSAIRPRLESGSIAGGPIVIAGSRPLRCQADYFNLPGALSTNRRANNFFAVLCLTGGGSLFHFGTSPQFAVYQSSGVLTQNFGGSSTWRVQAKHCLYESRQGASASSIWQDGETQAFGASSTGTMTGGLLGNTSYAGGFEAQAYYAMAINWGRELSAGERTALQDACNELFEIATPVSNRIIFQGDSICIASQESASPAYYGYAKMLVTQGLLTKPAAAYSFAGGGQQLQNQIGTFSSTVGVPLAAYSDNRVVLLASGTNDFNVGGRTKAQIYADMQTYCGLVRGAGGKVIICTILPATGYSGAGETARLDLNADIRANWSSFADGLCDFADLSSTMGATGAQSNTTLYQDGLHPTRYGQSLLAAKAAAAFNALLV